MTTPASSTVARALAPAAAIGGSLLLTAAATAQTGPTFNWNQDVNLTWQQFGNWSQILPPGPDDRVSVNPFFGPDPSTIFVDANLGPAHAWSLTVRDWNCSPFGCDFDASITGIFNPTAAGDLRIGTQLLVEADFDNGILGSGEANLTLSDLDILTGSVLVNEIDGADATLRVVDVDFDIRPDGFVQLNPGTVGFFEGVRIRNEHPTSTYAVTIQPASTLFVNPGAGESTIRGARLTALGSLFVNDILRVDKVSILAPVLMNAALVVDGDADDVDDDESFIFSTTTGGGRLVKDGTGILVLGGPAKFHVGDTLIRGGVVRATDGQQFGLGSLLLDGGTLTPDETPFVITENPVVISAGGATLDPEAAPISIDTVISGSGHLTKTGFHAFGANGSNTYSGGTTIAAGDFQANATSGSSTGSGPVSVQAGATLRGRGRVGGAVTVQDGGTVFPGLTIPYDVDDLNIQQVTFEAGSRLRVRITSTASGLYDQIVSGGGVVIDPDTVLEVELEGGYVPQPGDSFPVIDAADTVGSFGTLLVNGEPNADWCMEADGIDVIVRFQGDCGGEPACPADVTGDGAVGLDDLLPVLAAFGDVCTGCPADVDGNGVVEFNDLVMVIAEWGACQGG